MKRISIVVPCYNEAESIPRFHEAVSEIFKTIPYDLEIVFVNDGSTDESRSVLKALAQSDSRVRIVTFVQNFGQQAATAAGLFISTGDAMMLMDADLQHPPELIPEFIKVWEDGVPLVFGVRRARPGEGLERRLVSTIFGKLYNAGTGLPSGVSDFGIFDRSIVDMFKNLPPDRRMTRVRLAHIKGERGYVTYDINERTAGVRKYTLKKLLKLFVDNMVHSRPLTAGERLYLIDTHA